MTAKQKYNKWKLRKKAFKKLKEWSQYEIYIDHKILRLDNNNIEEIPSWIGELKELKELILANNNIKEIPSWIGGLKELKILRLANNNIEEIPSWIRELKKLKALNLAKNNIEEIPTETLKECDSLRRILLSRNPIPQKELERAKEEINYSIKNDIQKISKYIKDP